MAEYHNREALQPKGVLGSKMNDEREGRKREESGSGGGRRAIIVLLLLTVGLSLIFWMQRQLADWLRWFFGPSTWTFIR